MEKNNQNLKLDSKNYTFYFIFAKFFLLSAFCFLLSVGSAFAAETSFEVKNSKIQVGDKFEAGFFLNTEDEDINAVEGKIVFPKKLLELKEIGDGNSIINFWVERPKGSNGEILFSGIIPGGYMDKKGLIFSVVFQALQEGRGSIEIQDIKALLNDGKGTAANITISDLQFVISGQAPAAELATVEKKDTDMPESFEPIVTSDSTIFDGKYFLVFATQDKGSGIDHYEVLENRKQKIEDRRWVDAESPYVLKDQKLKSYIYVKAMDKVGNERIAVVEPRYPIKWYEIWWIWSIIILGLFILAIIGKIYGGNNRKTDAKISVKQT